MCVYNLHVFIFQRLELTFLSFLLNLLNSSLLLQPKRYHSRMNFLSWLERFTYHDFALINVLIY